MRSRLHTYFLISLFITDFCNDVIFFPKLGLRHRRVDCDTEGEIYRQAGRQGGDLINSPPKHKKHTALVFNRNKRGTQLIKVCNKYFNSKCYCLLVLRLIVIQISNAIVLFDNFLTIIF